MSVQGDCLASLRKVSAVTIIFGAPMSAFATSPLFNPTRAAALLSWDSLLTGKKMPDDPDANEPGTMPDEELAEDSPEFEEDDDFDMAPHPSPDENLMDDELITPGNTPRVPR